MSLAEPSLKRTAVLVSGGVDSATLVGERLRNGSVVHPLYVRSGLYWEDVERDYLDRFLDAVSMPTLRPLVVLGQPVADLYGSHWSITGRGVPGADTPDEAVFLPGRNVLLLAKALLWCHLNDVSVLELALLDANPFPDATPAFFTAYSSAVNQAVQGQVQIATPYAGLSKAEVLRRANGLPLGLTFSCIRPVRGRHCGACNKCEERRKAFQAARLPDPTDYDRGEPCFM